MFSSWCAPGLSDSPQSSRSDSEAVLTRPATRSVTKAARVRIARAPAANSKLRIAALPSAAYDGSGCSRAADAATVPRLCGR